MDSPGGRRWKAGGRGRWKLSVSGQSEGQFLPIATFAEKPDLWREASPITHVQPGDPPFLIVHGEVDEAVSLAQAKTFAAALRQAGVPVELQIVKGLGHDFDPIWQGWPNAPVTDPSAARLKAGMIEFLERSL